MRYGGDVDEIGMSWDGLSAAHQFLAVNLSLCAPPTRGPWPQWDAGVRCRDLVQG